MAASTRETQLKRSQPAVPVEYNRGIVELDKRSNPRRSVATMSSSGDCLIPEWKAYALVVNSFRALNRGRKFSDTRNDSDENLPL
jgi:hypothetical protein